MPEEPTDQQLAEWLEIADVDSDASVSRRGWGMENARRLAATIRALQAARQRIAALEAHIEAIDPQWPHLVPPAEVGGHEPGDHEREMGFDEGGT